jgi:hypothetical protein
MAYVVAASALVKYGAKAELLIKPDGLDVGYLLSKAVARSL